MKKILLSLLIILYCFSVTGCEKQETYPNGVPTYFLEPEGYVIAEIRKTNATLLVSGYYGYISNENYNDYLNGTLSGAVIIKNPYTEGKQIVVYSENIESIEVGGYEDMRKYQ